MTDLVSSDDQARGTIGPPATTLLLDNDEVRIWQMHVAAGERFWSHYHEYDYILYYLTDVLATAERGGGEEYEDTWQDRYDYEGKAGGALQGVMTHAGSLFFIPGTGFLSPGFHNVGDTEMLAPLIEIKRPQPPEVPGAGYARTDALVGAPLRGGCVHLLENDRVRVYQTILEPGATDEARPRLPSAVYVVSGGSLRLEAFDGSGGTSVTEEELADQQGIWRPAGVRRMTNRGAGVYRELSVEIK